MQSVSPIFAGRDVEMSALAEAMAADSTILVSGEAGVGKTRLIQEFAELSAATILTGGCVDLGMPYAPFTAAFRGLLGGEIELPQELATILPELNWGSHAGADGQAPDVARARLFEQVLILVEGLASTLVIEDAHWADRSSRDLLHFLVHNKAPRIIVTFRSDELHRGHPLRALLAQLDRLPWTQRLDLERLSPGAVAVQLEGILGHRPSAGQTEATYARSEGNPLFVEALQEDGELPDSLRDLLLLPIQRLPEETQEVLGTVSCADAAISHALLDAVTDLTGRALSSAIRPAVTANVITVEGDSYAFRHALIREAVHDDLLPGERTLIHRGYAEAFGGRPEDPVAAAHHWHAAHVIDRALEAAWRAAQHPSVRVAWAEQLELIERVLSLWDRVPDASSLIGAPHDEVLEKAVSAAYFAGRHERAVGHATKALAEPEVDTARAVRLLVIRGRIRWLMAREGDVADLRDAVRLAPPGHPGRPLVLADLASRLALIPEPVEAAQLAKEAFKESGDGDAGVIVRTVLAQIDAETGAFDQAAEWLAEAKAMALRAGSLHAMLRPFVAGTLINNSAGRYEKAVEIAREGLMALKQRGIGWAPGTWVGVGLSQSLFALGRWDEALELIGDALEGDPLPSAWAHMGRVRMTIQAARGAPVAAGELDGIRAILGGGTAYGMARLPLAQLEIELNPASAPDVMARISDEDLLASPIFAWPLLVAAARAGCARDIALSVAGGLQEAHQLTYRAFSDPSLWESAAAAWEALRQPYHWAQALLEAATVVISDREAAAVRLRTAFQLATSLGALPLRTEVERMARRAGIALDGAAPPPEQRLGLTARELEVLRLVAEGRGNREIAEELFISAKTASVHVSNIIAKLDVSSRGEAAAVAHRLALFD